MPTRLILAAMLALMLSPTTDTTVSTKTQNSGKVVNGLERRLYVADGVGVSIYDINDSHKLLHKLEIPDSGGYKGIAASVPLNRLYLTSNVDDELICLDLAIEKIVWRKKYGEYADSMQITPDGKRIYLPFRGEDSWWVIGADKGEVLAKIPVGRGKNYDDSPIGSIGPHNTWINPGGTRAYLEVLTLPYVYIADTATNQLIGKVGPFSKGVRPFVVTNDEKYVFANVDGLLGFEIGEVRDGKAWGGRMLHRIEAKTPSERITQVTPPKRKPHSTPSHGIGITPDQKEVWVVDGVYGYVYAYDVTIMPPKPIASVALFEKPEDQPHPGWISFSLDGKYAYPDGPAVIDVKTKKVVTRILLSEKLIEIDFRNGKAVKAGQR